MNLPEVGELSRRVRLWSVSHAPSGDSDLGESRDLIAETWAKLEIVGGSQYWDSVNVDETLTHRFWLRYLPGRTRPLDLAKLAEVECEGIFYRVKRCTDANAAHRFTLLECEELRHGLDI